MSENMTTSPLGPFFPIQKNSSLFAMYADEPTIFSPMEKLPAVHRQQREFVIRIIGMFQTAMMFVGDTKDSTVLFSSFLEEKWVDSFNWLYNCYQSLGLPMIPKENFHFLSVDNFYSELAQLNHGCENVIVTTLCHENQFLSHSKDALDLTQSINSKMELARNADRRSIPVPPSLVTSKQQLSSQDVLLFIQEHGPEVMMKISGMGGAFNVKRIQTSDEALAYLEEFPEETEVLLQKQLDPSEYQEMTVDFIITDKECLIENVRDVLVVDGMWVGNHLQKDIKLSKKQQEVLLRCAKWLQSNGYGHPNGYICGADFFLSDNDLRVIEINGRWTGGQVVERVQKKLGVGTEDIYAFLDKLSPAKMKEYREFVDKHLYKVGEEVGAFKVFPLGINPYVEQDQGKEFLMLWIMVIGDIEAFTVAKEKVLGSAELPTSNQIAAKVQGSLCLEGSD